MKYGYARVSTDDPSTAYSLRLEAGQVQDDFQRRACQDHDQAPSLLRCLKALQDGDTLIVWKLDRLGRSLAIYSHARRPQGARRQFRSSPSIDTETPTAGHVADDRRTGRAGAQLISERTRAE